MEKRLVGATKANAPVPAAELVQGLKAAKCHYKDVCRNEDLTIPSKSMWRL
jgi:hypothetical protein